MDLGHMNVVLKWCMCILVVDCNYYYYCFIMFYCVLEMFVAKTFAGTDLFPGTGLLAYGSQDQLYYALQWGKWHARQSVIT